MSRVALGTYFSRFLRRYRIAYLGRPRGLPVDYDEETAVRNHEQSLEVLARHADESVDVLGISMGGLIAQGLARHRPDLVDGVVLANSACRLSPEAHGEVQEFEQLAREHEWIAIRARLAKALYSDARSLAYPSLIHTVGRFVLPRPAVPADVWRSLQFIREFDGCGGLGNVEQRTLVFTGERDPYFDPAVARETAAGIPDGELVIAPGAKHGAFHERKWRFDSLVLEAMEHT